MQIAENSELTVNDTRVSGVMHVHGTTKVTSSFIVEETGELLLGSLETIGQVKSLFSRDRPPLMNRGVVSGSGKLGDNITLANFGTISANLLGKELTLIGVEPGNTSNPFDNLLKSSNRGILQAVDGGRLVLSSVNPFEYSVIDNQGGVIQASPNSSVKITEMTIEGGTLKSTPHASTPGVVSIKESTLSSVSLEGDISFGREMTIEGMIENNGTITSDGQLIFKQISINRNTTLTGSGSWELNHQLTFTSPDHSGNLPSEFINQDNTFRGAIEFDLDKTKFTNHGLIESISVPNSNGTGISVGSGGVINSGTIRATSNRIFLGGDGLIQNHYQLTQGLIEAMPGTEIYLNGVTIEGGILRAHQATEEKPAAKITIRSGGATLKDLTIEGTLGSPSDDFTLSGNIITLSGNIINRGSIKGDIEVTSDFVLSGGGYLEISEIHAPSSYDDRRPTITNLDNTIRGPVTIRGNIEMQVFNAGTIEANGIDQYWNNYSLIQNTGLMQAIDGGNLHIDNVDNRDGLIHAGINSRVIIQRLQGGVITTEGTGPVTAGIVTVEAGLSDIENQGTILIESASIGGEITNNGTIEITSDSNLQYGITRFSGNGILNFDRESELIQERQSGTPSFLINETGHTLSGSVTIDIQEGQFHNRGDILINDGKSTFRLGSGGTFQHEGTLRVQNGSDLQLLFNGIPSWSNRGLVSIESGSIYVRSIPTRNTSNSEISILAEGRLRTDILVNERGGLVKGSGTVELGSASDDVFQNSGTLSPGDEIGSLTIDGRFEQTEFGELLIEVGGSTSGEHDQLLISESATLDGQLSVSYADNYQPNFGDTFEIIMTQNFGVLGITGMFSDALLPSLSQDLEWRLTYEYSSVDLHVVLPGDFNSDGTVDAADYTVWRNNLGAEDELAIGYSGDGGAITESDYDLWLANFGKSVSASPTSSINSVPEPNTLVLLLLGTSFYSSRKRLVRNHN